MDIYNLGPVSWWESQCLYHALATLGREGVIICYTTTPYVCLGLHDDLEQEIDREYCQLQGLPVIRRETGGGVVYLDECQLFYQLVLRKDNPLLPLQRQRFYPSFLKPLLSVYRLYGVPAALNPPADIAVNGRKCSGNASGDIGQGVAFVGNILLDFDYRIMSKVLRVPGENFREHFCQAMQANMTTLRDWLRQPVHHGQLTEALINECSCQFGRLNFRGLDQVLYQKAVEVKAQLTSSEWLNLPGRKYRERRIKVAEGVFLHYYQSAGLGRIMLLTRNGIIDQATLLEDEGKDQALLKELIGRKWQEIVVG